MILRTVNWGGQGLTNYLYGKPQYMQYAGIRDYYTRLTKDSNSQPNLVNHLWHNILREYFLVREGFGLEIRPRVTKNDDVTIQHVKALRSDLLITRLVLALDERVFESEPPASAWSSGVSQLTDCIKFARTAASLETGPAQAERIFGIATVGQYSRFYVLEPGDDVLSYYPAVGGKVLEFEADESQIVELLLSIKAAALFA